MKARQKTTQKARNQKEYETKNDKDKAKMKVRM